MTELGPKDHPIKVFENWFEKAKTIGLRQPEAMTLVTATKKGIPSARVVLLKGVRKGKFVFFTNYRSHKAAEIEKNKNVALVFFWESLDRQVRIEGTAKKVSRKESQEYFSTRPRESQIGAWASEQSHKITSRHELEERFTEFADKFNDIDVPCPPHWGGYEIEPRLIEFWVGRPGRLHDRFQYVRKKSGADAWTFSRLSP